MMRLTGKMQLAVGVLLLAATGGAFAKVSAEEAGRLGKDLTPIGAEKAGSKDGSIPAWTPAAQRGTRSGEFAADAAIEAEKPLFTITAANMAQYADKLSGGHKYLLRTFNTYKLNVYPSHRTAAFPEFINKATAENAVKCDLVGVDSPDNCKLGFPYPIPKSGAEIIWNHRIKWRGDAVRRNNDQLIVQPDGTSSKAQLVEDVRFFYANEKNPVPLTKDKGLFLKYFSKITYPPRTAGTMILVHESGGTGEAGRAAWLYAPALKRIRRAPAVCCDNPYEGTDGNQFYDQVDMFNGVLERYSWKIIGKKDMVIPYDGFKISRAKYSELAKPKHLDTDLPRYEQHRVWIVEATLQPGISHTFSKRAFYIDEDSWNIVMVDCFDSSGGLFRFQEGHLTPQYNVQTVFTVPEVIYHFDSGRYFLTALSAEGKPNDYTVDYSDAFFDPDSVQKRASK
ncbi:MAG: DUF1329 domain-containing protein [Pseudomonadota bacterium]|nr:DUF1329 domain-containing protein [Pseudomonadota bacterium]